LPIQSSVSLGVLICDHFNLMYEDDQNVDDRDVVVLANSFTGI